MIARWQINSYARYTIALCSYYSGMDWLYQRLCGAGLVILMLHRVRDEPDPHPLSLSKRSLRDIVGWLRGNKALVSLDEGLNKLDRKDNSRVHFAITFDDGYRDNLRLIDHDMGQVPAVVYLATDSIGGEPIWIYRLTNAVQARTVDQLDLHELGLGRRDLSEPGEPERLFAELPPRLKFLQPEQIEAWIARIHAQLQPRPVQEAQRDMLDWDEVRTLDANGIVIGAHTCGHVLLSRVDEARARAEINGSRARLIEQTGKAPRHFAYPNGGCDDFGDRDVRLAEEAGFHTATTSIEGINRPQTHRFRLLRFNVHEQRFRTPVGHFSKALFFSETCGLLSWVRALRGVV